MSMKVCEYTYNEYLLTFVEKHIMPSGLIPPISSGPSLQCNTLFLVMQVLWISLEDGSWGSWHGQLVSCYNHPSRKHTATTTGKLGVKRSEAEAGHWAISMQTRALAGSKTATTPCKEHAHNLSVLLLNAL